MEQHHIILLIRSKKQTLNSQLIPIKLIIAMKATAFGGTVTHMRLSFMIKYEILEKANISSKRAIEKDNKIQADTFNKLKKRKMLEVLRMEVRLNKRDKIKQLFKTLGIKAELIFKKLFKPAISRTILLHYLDELESKRPMLLDYKARNDKASARNTQLQ